MTMDRIASEKRARGRNIKGERTSKLVVVAKDGSRTVRFREVRTSAMGRKRTLSWTASIDRQLVLVLKIRLEICSLGSRPVSLTYR